MKPGSELDKLIHEKIFGHKPGKMELNVFDEMAKPAVVPPYSINMADAMKVREKAGLTQIVWMENKKVMARWGDGLDEFAIGETEAHAICEAALKAIDK